MNQSLRITTPSRLHFGLLRLHQAGGPHYGGLGLMIDEPRCVVALRSSHQLSASGPGARRALAAARQALKKWPQPEQAAIRVCASPPCHVGLGSGTQLALAVARGITQLGHYPPPPIQELAKSVGRGLRSAVGSHGFDQGGIIWESGYGPGEALGQLTSRLPLPASWRILLIRPRGATGLHGPQETQAFAELAPVPTDITTELQQLAQQHILPAVQQANFSHFAAAVFQFGRLAGSCFATIQGGPYASPWASACIAKLRQLGIEGTGQSSWGPTIFAFLAGAAQAHDTVRELSQHPEFADANISITRPSNQGARIESSPVAVRT